MTQAKPRPRAETISRYFMSWPKFKKLLEAFDDSPGYRLSYFQGEAEILTVLPEHGRIAEILTFLLSIWRSIMVLTLRQAATPQSKKRVKLALKRTSPIGLTIGIQQKPRRQT